MEGTIFEGGDFTTWTEWYRTSFIRSFSEYRLERVQDEQQRVIRLARIATASARAEDKKAAEDLANMQGSTSGVCPEAEPDPSGASGVSPGASADMDVDQGAADAFEKEQKEARSRIFGGPVPEQKTTPMVQKKTRQTKVMEKMLREMEEALGKMDIDQEAPVSQGEKSSSSSGPSLTEIMLTPDEAWVTKGNFKFETYARRVIQYATVGLYGSRLNALLDTLRQAELSTIMERYKSLLTSLGWHAMFLPPAILEILCRRERRQTLEV